MVSVAAKTSITSATFQISHPHMATTTIVRLIMEDNIVSCEALSYMTNPPQVEFCHHIVACYSVDNSKHIKTRVLLDLIKKNSMSKVALKKKTVNNNTRIQMHKLYTAIRTHNEGTGTLYSIKKFTVSYE